MPQWSSLLKGINWLDLHRAMSYYAVARGHVVGIFDNWNMCEQQVKGYKGAKYRKFPTRQEAEAFIKTNSFDGASHLFLPQHTAVRLGANCTNSHWTLESLQQERSKAAALLKEVADFWPTTDCDVGAPGDFTDEELCAAIDGADDLQSTSTATSSRQKRKGEGDSSTSSIKRLRHESKIWEPIGCRQIGNHNFQIDVEGYVIVYTDGSCLNNGQKNACAGFGVFFGENHPLNAAKPVLGRVTNNVGEIQAAIYAIKTAKTVGITKICINTDSQFLINAVTIWIRTWKQKNWCLKNGDTVKNIADFTELDSLLNNDNLYVKWNYVKAHNGIRGNEMADKLAREGSALYRCMNDKSKKII